jgi:hypothetical protein
MCRPDRRGSSRRCRDPHDPGRPQWLDPHPHDPSTRRKRASADGNVFPWRRLGHGRSRTFDGSCARSSMALMQRPFCWTTVARRKAGTRSQSRKTMPPPDTSPSTATRSTSTPLVLRLPATASAAIDGVVSLMAKERNGPAIRFPTGRAERHRLGRHNAAPSDGDVRGTHHVPLPAGRGTGRSAPAQGMWRTFGSRSQTRIFLAAAMKPATAPASPMRRTPPSASSAVIPARRSSGSAAAT